MDREELFKDLAVVYAKRAIELVNVYKWPVDNAIGRILTLDQEIAKYRLTDIERKVLKMAIESRYRELCMTNYHLSPTSAEATRKASGKIPKGLSPEQRKAFIFGTSGKDAAAGADVEDRADIVAREMEQDNNKGVA